MLMVRESGDGCQVVKRRRMRDPDILDDRDLLMLAQHCQGRPNREIGRLFRITRQLVGRRINALPESVRVGMKRLVEKKLAAEGAVFIAEAEMEILKRIMRRDRKGKANRAETVQPVAGFPSARGRSRPEC